MAEMAEKQVHLKACHAKWELDLEKLGKAQRKTVRATLNRLQEAAVEEACTPGTAIQMHVNGLLQEVEKSLKSLKAYTQRLATENKLKDEKIKTWESIVKKVNKKFINCIEAMANVNYLYIVKIQ